MIRSGSTGCFPCGSSGGYSGAVDFGPLGLLSAGGSPGGCGLLYAVVVVIRRNTTNLVRARC
jgi:hypothetical protein